jgi:hypothetical protein
MENCGFLSRIFLEKLVSVLQHSSGNWACAVKSLRKEVSHWARLKPRPDAELKRLEKQMHDLNQQ